MYESADTGEVEDADEAEVAGETKDTGEAQVAAGSLTYSPFFWALLIRASFDKGPPILKKRMSNIHGIFVF